MKLLIHAINGVGLGHVIRTLRVADALKQQRPDVDIVFATNTQYDAILKKSYKTYTLKKNTRSVMQGECSYDEYLQYNTMALTKIIESERPDALLFDCELNRGLLAFCKQNLIKTVFILRNCRPERFSDIKPSLHLFDAVIVPHEQDEVPLNQREFLTRSSAAFTGPICSPYIPPENIVRKNILITFGAGANIPLNRPLFTAVDSFLKDIRTNNRVIDGHAVDIVTGPFYEGGCDLSGFPVRLTSGHLVRDMYGAKVIISAAGYNTINEIISVKTPAVVVPVGSRWDDQLQRAEFFEQLGCLKIAREGILGPVRDILSNWQNYHRKFPRMRSGHTQAAKILSEVLGSKNPVKV